MSARGFTGLHHAALITRDLERTAAFWGGTLGLPLTMKIEKGGLRHWFFEISPTESIAFFEFDAKVPEPDAFKMPGVVPGDGRQLDHLALRVETLDAVHAWRERLQGAGVSVRGPVDHGMVVSIYFEDPNAISLEVCWPR